MRRIGIFLLMILHLNVALIPHLNEMDAFDINTGKQVEDINTVAEWIRVSLGIDTTADDEDDDTEDSGQVPSGNFVYVCHTIFDMYDAFKVKCFNSEIKDNTFTSLEFLKIKSMFYDIDAPPPKA